MKKKIVSGIFSALFLLALLLPLCTTSLKQGDLSESENRTLAKFPQFVDPSGKISRKAVFGFESWFNDHIGFRLASSEAVSRMTLNVFHSSPSKAVHVGRDGWYYYTLEENLLIPFGEFPLDEQTLQNVADSQESIRLELEKMGIPYILVLTPSKTSIYPEYISSRRLAVRETPIDTLTAYLQAHTGVTVVNTKPALLEEKANGEQVYYKTCTHWNTLGSYAGFRSISDTVEQFTGKDMPTVEVTFHSEPHDGDLRGMMNASRFTKPEKSLECTVLHPKARLDADSSLASELDRIQNQPDSGWQGPSEVRYNDSAQGTILLFGDSFFGPNYQISEYFAECYHETVLIRCVTAYLEAIQLVKPDLVIMEITERGVPVLLGREMK
jgi:hypothetical protein